MKKFGIINRSVLLGTLLLFVIFFGSGCGSLMRDFKSPVELPSDFSATGDGAVSKQWWLSFGDPNLESLIAEGLGNNFSIRSAWDRLRQSEQLAVKSGVALLPGVNYSGGATRTGQKIANATNYTANYSLGVTLSYEIDFWGGIRSARQAALLDAEAASENVRTAAITLSANIAKTWYQLVEAKEKAAVLNKQLAVNEKVLSVITTQFQKGKVGASDVYRQQQLIESTKGQIIQTSEAMVSIQYQLSVLLGRVPGTYWAEKQVDLIHIYDLPVTGVPSDVIGRRPDVMSAYKAVQAADMRVASAVADQYPTLSISATASTSASRVNDLFDDWLANLAGNAVGPLFDAGFRQAEVRRTKAAVSGAINDYGQVVLEAYKQVEDALNQESHQRRLVENLQKQLDLSKQVYSRTEQNYMKAKLDYLRVLDSLVSQQNLEISELSARRVLIDRRIDLYKSIAGGFEMDRPELTEIEE